MIILGSTTYIICKSDKGHYDTHVSPESIQQQTETTKYVTLPGHEVLTDSLKALRTFAPFLTIVYSRNLWESIEGYNAVRTIGPDKFFGYKLLAQDPTVVYVPRPLFRYRDYQSANRAVQNTSLRQPIDDYLNTLEYKDAFLKPLGLTQQDLIDRFIDTLCLGAGLRQIGYANYRQGLSLFAFALASYPGTAIRNPKFYLLLLLVLLGPISTLLAPPALRAYRRWKGERAPTGSNARNE